MGKRKAPEDNHDLCDFLIGIANHEKYVTFNTYKASAYSKAAKAIPKFGERLKSGNEAKKFPGIGPQIAKKIDEFLEKDKLRRLEEETNVEFNLLTRVSGVDRSKARELIDSGIKTLEDLKKKKSLLNDHQKLGLKYFDDFEKKIPRDEIACVEILMQEAIQNLDKKYIMTICESYRRGKSESDDIYVVITYPGFDKFNKNTKPLLKKVVQCLEKIKLITATISQEKTMFTGVCKIPKDKSKPYRQLYIQLAPYDSYYTAILYYTGSDLFNEYMKAQALEKKYILNEYSLRVIKSNGMPGDKEKITSEEDIFRILNVPYKDPKDRDM